MIALLLDHLFESTVFAALMALLTLCFANNRAAVRYGLWFAASVKFLAPFAAIAAAGRALRWDTAPAVALDLPRLVADALPDVGTRDLMARDWAAPAAVADAYLAPLAAMPTAPGAEASNLDLGAVVLTIWLAGSVFLLCRWTWQGLRLAAVCNASTPAPFTAPIPVRFSKTLFEPGLVGIFRPILLLPEGIAAQLTPAQLALVIEHELCHWRRRDNLTAAVHMAVVLLFWFHPLLWWIGSRLVAERERACDESVLAACSDPKAYAGSILEVCRFYVRSPLPCAPGVAGANLKHRVERIMENVTSIRLSAPKLALLTALAAGATLLPMASGLFTLSAAAAPEPQPIAAPRVNLAPLAPPAITAALPVIKISAPAAPAPRPAARPKPEDVVVASASALATTPVGTPVTTPATAPAAIPVPPSTPLDEIIITAKKIREFVRTRDFVRSYTAPSEFLDQISRWHDPLCVRIEGLAPAYSAFVTARIAEVAGQIGAPKTQAAPCKPNLLVIFHDRPQALLDYIGAKRPDLLGPHYPALRKALTTVNHPIQAWYATATRDFRGRQEVDSYDAWWGTIPGFDEFGAPVYIVPGSHLRSGLTSEFASVIVVADKTKIGNWEIGTIADYIAMMALARAKTPDKCQQVPSIANALVDCADGVRAKSMSDFDMAYLKALYLTPGDAPRNLQESGISRTMLQILEKQVAEKKGAAE